MSKDNLAAQEKLHQQFSDLYFATKCPYGRRLPRMKDQSGNIVTGPWREYVGDRGQRRGVYIGLTDNAVTQHISGKLTQGNYEAALLAYQVETDDTAVLTGIDLDVVGEGHADAAHHFVTQEDALAVAKKIKGGADALGLTAWLEITKSAGYRVTVFHHRVPAADAQDLGHLLLKKAGQSPKIEVFPKQRKWSGTGSGLHLPYWKPNAEKGRQVILDWEMEAPLSLQEFVEAAWENRTQAETLAAIVGKAREDGELSPPAVKRTGKSTYEGGDRFSQPEAAKAGWTAQLSHCEALRGIVERMEAGNVVSYEEWLRLATHLRAYHEWGQEEFHRLSSLDSRYDAEETDELMDSLTGGPTTCCKMDCGRDPQADCRLPAGKVCSIAFAYRATQKQPRSGVAESQEEWKPEDCIPNPASQWMLSEEGILVSKQTKEGTIITKVISQRVYISGIARDHDTDTETVTVLWTGGADWRETTVSRRTISDSRAILDLADKGLAVNSGNARDVVAYIAHLLDWQRENIPMSNVVSTCGFKVIEEKRCFALGHNLVFTGEDIPRVSFSPGADAGGIIDALTCPKEVKDADIKAQIQCWAETARKLAQHPTAAFGLAAAFAAPLLHDLGSTQNIIIDFAGMSSTGKSTILRFAASVWGYPPEAGGGLIRSWNSTPVFLERLASITNDLPIFLDESHVAKPELVQSIIYQYANGTGKGRGALGGGTQRLARYRGVLFSAGEARLADVSQHDGMQARILGFWGSPFNGGTQPDLVREINATALRDYGIVGSYFLWKYLHGGEDMKARLIASYKEALQHLLMEAKDAIGERLAGMCAAIAAAAELASEMFDLGWDVPALINDAFARLTSNRKASSAQSSIELVGAWVVANKTDFDTTASSVAVGQRDVKGRWIDGDGKEAQIALLTEPLRCLLEKHGLRYEATLSHWRDKGWLDHEPERLTKNIRIAGKPTKAVVLNSFGVVSAMGTAREEQNIPTIMSHHSQEKEEEAPIADTEW